MMEQIDLFAQEKERRQEKRMEQMFQQWLSLPEKMLVTAADPRRGEVKAMLQSGYCLTWQEALHQCQELPPEKYIWLNYIEPAEYWVMNDVGDPAGEHVETCPFCGANLKAGGGDVLMVKADDGWWVIKGFVKGDGRNV